MSDFNKLWNDVPAYVVNAVRDFDYLRGLMNAHYDAQGWRAYHNYEHLRTMLVTGKERSLLSPSMVVAILFHDIIYDLRNPPGVNEALSAQFAMRYGPECFKYIDWVEVFHLIMATKHTDTLTRPSEQFIADLDLCTFASDFETFSKIGDNIITEYCRVFPRKQVLLGRIDFLEKFSQKDRIFYTNHFSNDIAFDNIHRELERIRNLV